MACHRLESPRFVFLLPVDREFEGDTVPYQPIFCSDALLTEALHVPYEDPPLIHVLEVSLDQWFAGGRGTKRSWT